MVSLDQQIACLKKELERLKAVTPRLVRNGRLSEAEAAFELLCMESAYRTLTQLKGITGV